MSLSLEEAIDNPPPLISGELSKHELNIRWTASEKADKFAGKSVLLGWCERPSVQAFMNTVSCMIAQEKQKLEQQQKLHNQIREKAQQQLLQTQRQEKLQLLQQKQEEQLSHQQVQRQGLTGVNARKVRKVMKAGNLVTMPIKRSQLIRQSSDPNSLESMGDITEKVCKEKDIDFGAGNILDDILARTKVNENLENLHNAAKNTDKTSKLPAGSSETCQATSTENPLSVISSLEENKKANLNSIAPEKKINSTKNTSRSKNTSQTSKMPPAGNMACDANSTEQPSSGTDENKKDNLNSVSVCLPGEKVNSTKNIGSVTQTTNKMETETSSADVLPSKESSKLSDHRKPDVLDSCVSDALHKMLQPDAKSNSDNQSASNVMASPSVAENKPPNSNDVPKVLPDKPLKRKSMQKRTRTCPPVRHSNRNVTRLQKNVSASLGEQYTKEMSSGDTGLGMQGKLSTCDSTADLTDNNTVKEHEDCQSEMDCTTEDGHLVIDFSNSDSEAEKCDMKGKLSCSSMSDGEGQGMTAFDRIRALNPIVEVAQVTELHCDANYDGAKNCENIDNSLEEIQDISKKLTEDASPMKEICQTKEHVSELTNKDTITQQPNDDSDSSVAPCSDPISFGASEITVTEQSVISHSLSNAGPLPNGLLNESCSREYGAEVNVMKQGESDLQCTHGARSDGGSDINTDKTDVPSIGIPTPIFADQTQIVPIDNKRKPRKISSSDKKPNEDNFYNHDTTRNVAYEATPVFPELQTEQTSTEADTALDLLKGCKGIEDLAQYRGDKPRLLEDGISSVRATDGKNSDGPLMSEATERAFELSEKVSELNSTEKRTDNCRPSSNFAPIGFGTSETARTKQSVIPYSSTNSGTLSKRDRKETVDVGKKSNSDLGCSRPVKNDGGNDNSIGDARIEPFSDVASNWSMVWNLNANLKQVSLNNTKIKPEKNTPHTKPNKDNSKKPRTCGTSSVVTEVQSSEISGKTDTALGSLESCKARGFTHEYFAQNKEQSRGQMGQGAENWTKRHGTGAMEKVQRQVNAVSKCGEVKDEKARSSIQTKRKRASKSQHFDTNKKQCDRVTRSMTRVGESPDNAPTIISRSPPIGQIEPSRSTDEEPTSLLSLVSTATIDVTVAHEDLVKQQALEEAKNTKRKKKKGKRKKPTPWFLKQQEKEREYRERQIAKEAQNTVPAVCRFFQQGKCARGATCLFRHEKIKELCPFHAGRGCDKLADGMCPYLHDEFPCMFFHKRQFCYLKDSCKFSHKPLTEETKVLLDNYFESFIKKRKEERLSVQLGVEAKANEDESLRSDAVTSEESVGDLTNVESSCPESEHEAEKSLPKVAGLKHSSPSTSSPTQPSKVKRLCSLSSYKPQIISTAATVLGSVRSEGDNKGSGTSSSAGNNDSFVKQFFPGMFKER